MKIRNKLIVGFTAITLISGAMGFSAVDGILRTNRLTDELFEYPLMAGNFARDAQTAFARIRLAGDDQSAIAQQEGKLREDLAMVMERLRDPAAMEVIAHIEFGLEKLARLRLARARLLEQGDGSGEIMLRREVAYASIDENLATLVELAVARGFDFMRAAKDESEAVFTTQLILVLLVLGLGLGIALYLGREFARPIRAITAVTTRLAAGDDQVEIPGGGRRDEIGAMARALEIFKANVKTIRRHEADLIGMRDSLERRVRERTGELDEAHKVEDALRRAKEEADLANRAKTNFLATMSHELRTPLNAIIGFSEIIKEETFGPVGAANYIDYAQDIRDSGYHLLKLIEEVLDYSKVDSGNMELVESEILVPEVIETCVALTRELVSRGKLTAETDIPDNLPCLWADRLKVNQVLINLLSNAAKFTEPGGKIGIRAWAKAESGFVFQIYDSGIGMALDDVPEALSPFGQVDSALNRQFQGTGLGLPLAKRIIELHGGSLDLQSELGKGTIVTARFPSERIRDRAA